MIFPLYVSPVEVSANTILQISMLSICRHVLFALFWIFTTILPYWAVGWLFTVWSVSSTILVITHDCSAVMHIVIRYNTCVFILEIFLVCTNTNVCLGKFM